jgi:hypothetical protein
MGSEDTEHPEYQVGHGCLIDQMVGQYLAEVADLGALLSPVHVRAALASLYRFNYKRSLLDHDNVERTFALNDESAIVICDYAKSPRPRIPFPYYAEVMTGFEHSAAALMIYSGMVAEGLECIGNIRSRYDGEKRNPWDEAECGHHYARAMAAWTSLVALSGFAYDGVNAAVRITPRVPHQEFRCFWSTGTGWGTFSYAPSGKGGTLLSLEVLAGKLPQRTCEFSAAGTASSVRRKGNSIPHSTERQRGCQGRSETRPLWRSKSRPVGRCWVVVRLSGEKGRWSVAEAALLPRGTFGGVRFSVRRTESVCGGSA